MMIPRSMSRLILAFFRRSEEFKVSVSSHGIRDAGEQLAHFVLGGSGAYEP